MKKYILYIVYIIIGIGWTQAGLLINYDDYDATLIDGMCAYTGYNTSYDGSYIYNYSWLTKGSTARDRDAMTVFSCGHNFFTGTNNRTYTYNISNCRCVSYQGFYPYVYNDNGLITPGLHYEIYYPGYNPQNKHFYLIYSGDIYNIGILPSDTSNITPARTNQYVGDVTLGRIWYTIGTGLYIWDYTLTGGYSTYLSDVSGLVLPVLWGMGVATYTGDNIVVYRLGDPGAGEPEIVVETTNAVCSTYYGSDNICLYMTGGIIYTYILNQYNDVIDSGAIDSSALYTYRGIPYNWLSYSGATSTLYTYRPALDYYDRTHNVTQSIDGRIWVLVPVLTIQHPPSGIPSYTSINWYTIGGGGGDTGGGSSVDIGIGDGGGSIFGTVNCDSDGDGEVGIVEGLTCIDDYLIAYVLTPLAYPYNAIVENGKNILDKLKQCNININQDKQAILSGNNAMFSGLFSMDNNTQKLFALVKWILIIILYLLTIYIFIKS